MMFHNYRLADRNNHKVPRRLLAVYNKRVPRWHVHIWKPVFHTASDDYSICRCGGRRVKGVLHPSHSSPLDIDWLKEVWRD